MKRDDKKITENTQIDLENNANDYVAILIKNAVSTGVPILLPMFTFMASYLGDMIINFIPNQRLDRVVNFVQLQSEKLEALDENLKETIKETMYEPETIPFVEKVIKMVVESETEQKRKYLASILNNGLSVDKEQSHRAQLMKLIDELDELDILRLYGATLDYDYHEKAYNEFWDKHEETFYFEPEWDDEDEADRKEMISRIPTTNLIRLGLIDDRKISAKVTRLGAEVLRFIEAEENVQI